jgi:hypothetical protein
VALSGSFLGLEYSGRQMLGVKVQRLRPKHRNEKVRRYKMNMRNETSENTKVWSKGLRARGFCNKSYHPLSGEGGVISKGLFIGAVRGSVNISRIAPLSSSTRTECTVTGSL